MTTVTLDEAKARLGELIGSVAQGESIIILENEMPVARLVPPDLPVAGNLRKLGFLKGILTVKRDDDSHLDDFADYL